MQCQTISFCILNWWSGENSKMWGYICHRFKLFGKSFVIHFQKHVGWGTFNTTSGPNLPYGQVVQGCAGQGLQKR